MLSLNVQTADWKNEKHVPVITCADQIVPGKPFEATVKVGEAIPHPNTPVHHIMWIALHFIPEGSKISYELARCEFSAHSQTAEPAPAVGPVATDPTLCVTFIPQKPGKLVATSYCNIHGLWGFEKDLK